jgi:hypothetical protein
MFADPNHSPVDVQDTDFVDLTTTDNNGNSPDTEDQTMHLSWADPTPGLWTLDLGTLGGSTSGKTSSTLSGTVSFNTVHVTSSGVPDSASTMLQPDATHVAHVTVTNTGNSPEIYYVDPRLAGTSTYSLGFINNPNSSTVGETPQALVPPESTSMSLVANSARRVDFSPSPAFGTPELLSTIGTTAVASLSEADIPASEWSCGATPIGPFSSSQAPTKFSCAGFATTRTFDDTIASTGGNLWDAFTDPNSTEGFDPSQAQVVQPGASTTITVDISPTDDQEGETVTGDLAVQTFDINTFSSDELIHIPYKYTVATPSS